MHNNINIETDASGDVEYGQIFVREKDFDMPGVQEITENGLDLAMASFSGDDDFTGYFFYENAVWILHPDGTYRALALVDSPKDAASDQALVEADLKMAAKRLVQAKDLMENSRIELMLDESTFEAIIEADNPTVEVNQQVHYGYSNRGSQSSTREQGSKSSDDTQETEEGPAKASPTELYEQLPQPKLKDISS